NTIVPLGSGSPTSPTRWSSSDTGATRPTNRFVVVSQRPTIITLALSPATALSYSYTENTRGRGDAIAGYDEVARSSALERWANIHAPRPISTQCCSHRCTVDQYHIPPADRF